MKCRLPGDLCLPAFSYTDPVKIREKLEKEPNEKAGIGRDMPGKERDMGTIRVTGKGSMKLHPDMTRITMELGGQLPEYAETLRMSAKDTEELKDVLSGYGFERTDLKTLDFSVDPDYESYKEKGVYRQKLVGYRYRHLLKVEFDSDRERLGKLLYALAHCSLQPEIRISYTVRDPEAVKNALIGKAVLDAKEKAAALTEAAGIGLKGIQSIDYSWREVSIECFPMQRNVLMADTVMENRSAYDLDLEPDDVEAADTVTVVWEIG